MWTGAEEKQNVRKESASERQELESLCPRIGKGEGAAERRDRGRRGRASECRETKAELTSEMGGDMVPLCARDFAALPLAGQAEVLRRLASDVAAGEGRREYDEGWSTNVAANVEVDEDERARGC